MHVQNGFQSPLITSRKQRKLRGQKKPKPLLSQPSESYDLQPRSTFMPVLISDFFSVEGNYS